MKRSSGSLLLLAVIAIGGALFYYAVDEPPGPMPPSLVETPMAEPPASEPEVRHPLPGEAGRSELPPLGVSDAVVTRALAALWGERVLEALFNLDGLVRRVVATIDSLPRRQVSMRLMPVKPAPGGFRTTGAGENLAISPGNSTRYARYVRFADGVDSARLVSLYVRHYPLFQQAYEELGYPRAYFNDRLLEVIDHLLDAPELPARTRLVQPKVFYGFEDAGLEARSSGQKIMMRMGKENAGVIKAKLLEIRAELVRNAGRE